MDTHHSEYPPDHPRAVPDVYTNFWYRQQFRGVQHSLNRCNAEYASVQDQIEALQSRCERLETALADSFVEIGKLREELSEQMEKVRQAYKELKNGKHT